MSLFRRLFGPRDTTDDTKQLRKPKTGTLSPVVEPSGAVVITPPGMTVDTSRPEPVVASPDAKTPIVGTPLTAASAESPLVIPITPAGAAAIATPPDGTPAKPSGGATAELADISHITTEVPLIIGATRKLEDVVTPATPNRHLIYGMSTDVGVVRTNNQDSLYTMFSTHMTTSHAPDFGLFVVADGMGGHLDGERASAIATQVIAQSILNEFYLKLIASKNEDDRPMIADVLTNAVLKANDAVADQIPDGGTTVTAVAVLGEWAYVAHVGDSRAYLLTREGADQITRDHSLVQRLIELDQLTPEDAQFHPQRNVLYRALGQGEQLDIDTATRRLPPGSRLLLCSDGLWGQVPEDVLLSLVKASPTPQEACDKLVAVANERGGNDNVTVILVQIPG
ncbi:MAG TPA: protein phosphatase 2C domain-containing protein [Aggregatilineales bacterium]|nr:protein phosphatase 2C domain-containing protein [Anaerolineales bacterium]HRE46738.1 protein phosphatase 2C domain-containing protein [Aggregatilineales bacterium]